MTKEEIIDTLLKMGIRTEDELELRGNMGLELEPNGNKILYMCNSRLGSLYKNDDGNYKIDIDHLSTLISSDITRDIKDLASITTFEDMDSLENIYTKMEECLNNIKLFIEYYKGIK